jgi:dienelactone hydrolase
MRKVWLLLMVMLTTVLVAAAPWRPTPVHVVIPESSGVQLQALLYLPRGAQRGPAVVALHGCGGPFPRRDHTWARRLARDGHAVLLPDSFASRDEKGECRAATHGTSAYGARRDDALAAAAWLARRPGTPAGGVALLGWSDGGTTVLATINRAPDLPPGLIRTAIAFYPACFRTLHLAAKHAWEPAVPLTILMGAADDWTPPHPCADLATRFPTIHLHLYPGAYHDFDVPRDPVHLIHHLPYTLHHTGTAHAGENVTARSEALITVPLLLAR